MLFWVWVCGQAVSAELTLYDSTVWPAQVLMHPENLLRIKTTFFGE